MEDGSSKDLFGQLYFMILHKDDENCNLFCTLSVIYFRH